MFAVALESVQVLSFNAVSVQELVAFDESAQVLSDRPVSAQRIVPLMLKDDDADTVACPAQVI